MQRLLLLLLALAVSAPTAFAQSAALSTALDHITEARTSLGLTTADLGDVAVTDEYVSRHNGVTHLYLRQTVNGIEVYNGRISAHVTTEGRVHGVHSTFVADIASKASTAEPSLTAEAAVEAAAAALGLTVSGSLAPIEPVDERRRVLLADGGISLSPIPVQLVYFVTEEGDLRLAYDLSIEQRDAQNWWSVRVDAETGALLDQTDWVIHDEFAQAPAADLRPIAPSPSLAARGSASGSYNVWAMPLESPSHGERTLEATPHNVDASPLGWHDTGNTQYTITRGNNVHAYEDRAANNSPGYAPDGGESLLFDFPVDLETQSPEEYEDAAITNLFYWNNILHDVLHRYGFDEPAGNFQVNNFENGGLGSDDVRAEAQDGSGTNNANFGTPPDGNRPRMQMFQWTGSSGLTIVEPVAIAGVYASGSASFGSPFAPDFPQTEIVPLIDSEGFGGDGGAGRACPGTPIANPGELEGKIALIERGDCEFGAKVLNAEEAGAIAVIIHNNDRTGDGETGSPEDIITMGGGEVGDQVTIPSAFVARSTGLLIIDNLPVEGYVRSEPNRDSDLDNGVIAHEYGHGVSNRLTGGPSAAGCLSNEEQMGEGWSDYLGLMLTMREGDTAEQGRGIGTYVSFEPTDGPGIRPFPYSTDMSVNPSTYATIANPNISVPHGLGSVWSQMLWEMTWDLIAEEGFDSDFYEGTGGNNIAMQLVLDGMKLQACSPGFVDGRDAILEADTLTYDGAYSDIIWRSFARRGLGFSADQGSSNSRSDGTEAFDLPPTVPTSGETAALPNGYALSAAYPNPFSGRAQFTLEVGEAQDIRVTVYDVMGRTVATLHDGPLASGSRHVFEMDGDGLASGVYLVRVTGDTFAETQRVTLLR